MSKDSARPLNVKGSYCPWEMLSLLNALNTLYTKLVDICLSRYFNFLIKKIVNKITFTFENG